MNPNIEVVVISWNGRDDTLRAVEAVAAQIGPGEDQYPDASITVVDNGSKDGTAEAVLRRFPGVKLLELRVNRGFTGGIDAAADASAADSLIFLNNDAVPEPRWLRSFASAMRNAPPDVVAISGRIVDSSATKIDFIGGLLTFDGHAFQRGFRKPIGSVPEPDDGEELLFACGGNMIVRRREFLELGGFDDDYFAYLEDVDFGWRAWLSGYRISFDRSAVVRHKSSATSDRLGAFERGVLFERNALQTAIKNLDPEMLPRFAGPIFLTLLHRLHCYTVDRNQETSPLRRPALDSSAPGKGRKMLDRLLRRRSGPAIDDPLTVMQFRAMEWFFANSERLMEKRRTVQARRRISDREIFEKFPLFYVPTYHGDEAIMQSALFRALMPEVPSRTSRLDEIMQP
ncbi:MAG: glycosyltransferase family 2 protein [Thermoanaerobaculia bacterium]